MRSFKNNIIDHSKNKKVQEPVIQVGPTKAQEIEGENDGAHNKTFFKSVYK